MPCLQLLTHHCEPYTSAEPVGPGSDPAEPVGLVEVVADGAEPTFEAAVVPAAADVAECIRRMEAAVGAED